MEASTYEEEVENESEKDEDLAIITRKFRKFMKDERFKGRRFPKERSSSCQFIGLKIHLYCKVHKQLKYSMLASRS